MTIHDNFVSTDTKGADAVELDWRTTSENMCKFICSLKDANLDTM